MKKLTFNWKHLLAGFIVAGGLSPLSAHADQGVFLKSYDLKDEAGNVVHTFQKEYRVQFFESGNDAYYSVEYENQKYLVEKDSIFKTHNEEEISLSVNNLQAGVKLTPSLFSPEIQMIPKDDIVHRVDSTENSEYWVRIQTENGLIGYVYEDYLNPNYKATPVETKAYISYETTVNGKYFEYGQEVSLSDFQNGSFIVKEGEHTYPIPQSNISFEKPTKPLILTPQHSFPNQLKIYGNPEFISPVHDKYPRVTSRYGQRWGRLHAGTDVGIPVGTPLYAVADGVVTNAVKNQTHSKTGWGNYVKINHNSSTDTLYAHMSKLIVSPGQYVKQGQLIGYSGNSGRSTGPHLHFELYKHGQRIDSYSIVHQPHLYR